MPYFSRISSASISARGITGIFMLVRFDDFRIFGVDRGGSHDDMRAITLLGLWPSKIVAPRFCRRSVIGESFVSEPETE